ncbi:MAG TPA: cell division protein FtsA [Acidobacteriota bacterium]|jgi:cell division protein FtsA
MAKKTNLITVLDIGASKTCAMIAELNTDSMRVLGAGVAPTEGYKRAVVTSISDLVESIRNSVQEAERQAAVGIESVFVAVAGSQLQGMNGNGVIPIRNKNREVTRSDIYGAIDAARNFKIPEGMVVIHVLPQEFTLDGQSGISDPLGMMGEELGVRIHVIVNTASTVQNIINVINKSGLIVAGTVMPQLAAAMAVLTWDEKDLGTAVIDIGGGTTDVAVYLHGTLCHSETIPMGGQHFTKDISVGIRTPLAEAEKLKREHGCAEASLVALEELLEVSSLAGTSMRLISREMLCQVIQARAEEVFTLVQKKIDSWQCRRELVAGAVLTGGMSLVQGMDAVAERILGMPVRPGIPVELPGLDESWSAPEYATTVGLLLYAQEARTVGSQKMIRPEVARGLFDKASGKMRHWFLNLLT